MTADGSNPLETIEAFRTFGQGIAQRCEDGPIVTTATVVGSFRPADPEVDGPPDHHTPQ